MQVDLRLDPALHGSVEWHDARRRPLIDPRLHRHRELECNLVLRGWGWYLSAGRRYDLEAGALVWLFPDEEHMIFEQSDDFAMWVCVFTPALIEAQADALPGLHDGRDPAGRYIHLLRPRDRVQLDRLCSCLSAPDLPTPARNTGLAWLLVSAWRAFAQATAAVDRTRVHPVVARVATWLQAGDDRRQGELAEAAGVSAAWLSRTFKREMGLPLTEFRMRQRLQRFVDLMTDVDPPTITDAVYAAGWGSYAQFHKDFVRVTGSAPRTWLAQHGGEV